MVRFASCPVRPWARWPGGWLIRFYRIQDPRFRIQDAMIEQSNPGL
ncbi:hypothetical protein D3OALGB2SA_5135 [Olavius algarvensis associated proteobacterium Delta 3]|nr:hypothetical protein D3OALGB2SA_5135 [Olavius algarvensis associated proteobacterium Delta 3]